tara:strand:- start:10085 stop:10606 length:522 start_codon:yes stop_codon:yes gene_type:complete
MKATNVDKVLDAFGKKVVLQARNILNSKGKNASGNLDRSLGYFIKVFPSGALDMSFVAEGYADIVDKGIKGSKSSAKAPMSPYKYTNKMPPTRILDKWAVRKGISGIRNNKGQFVSRKSLIFVIARNIKLFGIKPSNFFTDAFNTAYKTLPRQFMQAYAKDAAKFLKFVSKEL